MAANSSNVHSVHSTDEERIRQVFLELYHTEHKFPEEEELLYENLDCVEDVGKESFTNVA